MNTLLKINTEATLRRLRTGFAEATTGGYVGIICRPSWVVNSQFACDQLTRLTCYARALLHDWPTAAQRFIKVAPKDQPATQQPLPIPLALLNADLVPVGELVR